MRKKEGLQVKPISFIKRNLKAGLLALFMLMAATNVSAQSMQISGVVSDENNATLPGVSIVIKGSTVGTITDFDGKYQISVNKGDVLIYSFVGYADQEKAIDTETKVNISLQPDLVGLDEVVVIGYGVQKKKLNTGATVNVKGDDIQKMNTVSPIDALKSNSPGVNITADNGLPGSGSKVTIRGIGTMGNASPLYVVDGVSVDNIDYLSPSDIESIDILKDAASTAIYGSRAANGVILVTTKKGTAAAKPTITYDSYLGWQQIDKRPGMLNAQQYMELVEEGWAYDNKVPAWDKKIGDDWEDYRNGTDPGTNWVDQLYNENAPIESHALGITGGTSASTYAMGISYLKQEGVLGDPLVSTYERLNARLNSEHVIIERNNRKILKVGEVFTYSNFSKPNMRTGGIYWNDLRNAITMHPLLPMYADSLTPAEYGAYHEPIPWNSDAGNPVAGTLITQQYNENKHNNMVGNAYAILEPIDRLIIKSSYGFNGSYGRSRSYVPVYKITDKSFADKDRVSQEQYMNYTYTFTNTINYAFNVAGAHNFNVMLGQESRKQTVDYKVKATRDSTSYSEWDRAYLDLTPPQFDNTKAGVEGFDKNGYGMLSYFARVSYDFNESLMGTFVYRADASNNLAPGHQWGGFMSVSAGYILSNLEAIQAIPVLDYLKVRGGWGQNGNERISAFQYNASLKDENGDYVFSTNPNNITVGRFPDITPNRSIGWETSEQASLGFDAHFLNSRLQFNFDLYSKNTKDWLVKVPKPLSNGTKAAIQNGGAVTNNGVEMAINWSDQVGDFKYSVGANFAYNKNEVTQLDADGGYFNGPASLLANVTNPANRVEVGMPIGYFYGYQTSGVAQDSLEAAAYIEGLRTSAETFAGSTGADTVYDGQIRHGKTQEGDLMFVDKNGDGIIGEEDKVMIGDPTPDYTFGINISAEYKGVYLAISANGAAGHQVAMSYGGNTEYSLGRWHGEGTSNTQPRLTRDGSHINYSYISDYYIHDANFLRISNITLGYDMNTLFPNSPMKEVRVYVSAKNMFTITKYAGMTPEVGFGGPDTPWGSGVDVGLYPQAQSFMVGLSAKF